MLPNIGSTPTWASCTMIQELSDPYSISQCNAMCFERKKSIYVRSFGFLTERFWKEDDSGGWNYFRLVFGTVAQN